MPLNNKRKPVRLLSNLRIDEISAVDRGAREGVKIVLAKRNSGTARVKVIKRNGHIDHEATFAKIFGIKKKKNYLGYDVPPDLFAAKLWREAARRKNDFEGTIPKAGDNEGYFDTEDDDDDDNGSTEPFLAGSDEGEATGSTDQLTRAERAMKEKTMKKDTVLRICKQMVDANDAYSITENDLVTMIDAYAKVHGTTFAKLLEAQDDTGLAIRKAVDIAKYAGFGQSSPYLKAATLEPEQVGGATARSVDNPRSALDQIFDLIAEQRRQHPELELTDAQWFARVYESPANRDIAKRERAENRPR